MKEEIERWEREVKDWGGEKEKRLGMGKKKFIRVKKDKKKKQDFSSRHLISPDSGED